MNSVNRTYNFCSYRTITRLQIKNFTYCFSIFFGVDADVLKRSCKLYKYLGRNWHLCNLFSVIQFIFFLFCFFPSFSYTFLNHTTSLLKAFYHEKIEPWKRKTVYWHYNPLGKSGEIREKFANHEPEASVLQIIRVAYYAGKPIECAVCCF